jgi:kynureninase
MTHWNDIAKALQKHYSNFQVTDRILLTGHSHQAWPDCARDAQLEAFDDAAKHVDDKWEKAFEKADQLRTHFSKRLGDSTGDYVFGTNTQELLVRWLSALPLTEKTKIITTDGEFHSMRRLMDRLNETSIDVVKVSAQPVSTLTTRLLNEVDENTAAVMCSLVMFQTSEIVPNTSTLAAELSKREVPFLLDAYHLVNIVPFSIDNENLQDVFVVGGGYKYCQLGEGNCFLRVPKNCNWRPLVTGWYAEFASLDQKHDERVQYGLGRWAFEGSTYDPTSHYRAVKVFQFFDEQGLTVERLREINLAQQNILFDEFEKYAWPESIQLPVRNNGERGGFVVVKTETASELVAALRAKNIWVDSRQEYLRIGPAPYVTQEQLVCAIEELHRSVLAL